MKNIYLARLLAGLISLMGLLPQLSAQTQDPDPGCFTVVLDSIVPTSAFFNYGSGTRMKNFTSRTRLSIGQPAVGLALGDDNNSYFGFWTSFLVAPLPPMVTATQGELLDRIQLSWSNNPLGPFPNQGFKIFRDGVFLASVDSDTRNFNDFNVIAGIPYQYEVRGVNVYGTGQPGKALGFQVPNGVVTGWVRTVNDSPVPDALVALTPLQGFSARFDVHDGATYLDTSATGFLPPLGQPWSLTFWIKTNEAAPKAGIIQLQPFMLNIRAIPGGGIEVDNAPATTNPTPFLSAAFTNDEWHHVALSYDGNQMRLYVDGVLKSLNAGSTVAAAEEFLIGARTDSTGWKGKIDEIRLYHLALDEISLGPVMEATASSFTPGLKLYWKMDEQQGTKSFDILNRKKLFFCGAVFDADRPNVRTAGITNSDGFYRIESASYGTGTTFLAKPMKNFYLHRALQFTRSLNSFATLPDFSLTPKSTIEMWVYSAGPDDDQCLLSKRWPGNDFRLLLIPQTMPPGLDNTIRFYLNGQFHDFGLLGMGYQHLAFTIDSIGTDRTVTFYKNGNLIGSHTFTGISGNWSDPSEPWYLGARPSGGGQTNHFGGLIDEIAVYDTTLAQATIAGHAQNNRDFQEPGLRVYFPMDEGSGVFLNNAGSLLLGSGVADPTTSWSSLAANQETTPHEFAPNTRQVTLNPSVTSVDQVDFTDRSTIAVSGFVRYNGTDCFAENVEILVNGESFNPQIFTDSTGKFVIDFEPGTTATLTPVYRDHNFLPATFQVTNISSPIAGVLFTDMESRKINGEVVGGECKRSIIDGPGIPIPATCIVKVRSLNGCFEREQLVDADGKYSFSNLPPIPMTVAVVEHSDPTIKNAFDAQGGSQVDLTDVDTTVNFTYYAQPEVEISGLDAYIRPGCTEIVLNQYEQIPINIRVFEQYYDGVCYVDTAAVRINDGFGEIGLDTTLGNGVLMYKSLIGAPNASPPYLKTFQAVVTTLEDNQSEKTVQALITGIKAKTPTFTTKLADMPTMILRDPPGDASYSYLETGQTHCNTVSFGTEEENGNGKTVNIDLGPDFTIIAFTYAFDIEAVVQIDLNFATTMTKVSENSLEVCQTALENISTSDGDQVIGDQGGDVYMGLGLNISVGLADKVTYNDTTCTADVQVITNVSPDDFVTSYMYSEKHINNQLIRYLDLIIDDIKQDPDKPDDDTLVYYQSKMNWLKAIALNDSLQENAVVTRNISFDAGVAYEYAVTVDSSFSQSVGTSEVTSKTIENAFGGYANGLGAQAGFAVDFSSGKSTSNETGSTSSVTTGFVLADDDAGDAFTIDIADDPVFQTPVFKLRYGQTSCPWEPGTASRQSPNLEFRDGSGPVAVDIPSNEAAVFKFTLGNASETNEKVTYGFSARTENNPDGAIIKLNGAVMTAPIEYEIEYGESVPITVTVERGPEAYAYDSLEVLMHPLCDGLDTSLLVSSRFISVFFVQPCSEVDINVPQQDWVIFPDPVTPGSDDVMRITVSGYDKSQEDFDRIRVQYRRSDGDGAWINIVPPVDSVINIDQPGAEIVKDSLGPVFTQFFWNTEGLADGPYEIRAVAVCTGDASDRPGFSHIIKGRIDRQPPSLLGLPEPSDGVYNVGDEISFTFNQEINCGKLNPVDDVLLYDATTNQLVDIDITCYQNKIVFDPNFQNEFLENRILRAELHDIEDMVGNNSTFFKWEFYVDRNELAWLTDSLGVTKYENEPKTGTASIHNRGGYPVPFTLENIPEWAHVVPNQGTLAPNEILPVQFHIDSTLAFGRWSDSIFMKTETGQNPFFMGGTEGLPVGVRVVCRPPYGDFNPNLFENSMTMVLRVNIEGVFSSDPEDMVAAFIDDELRGRAFVQYVPQLNGYRAYLVIYGDPDDMLKPIRLEVWDASHCERYGSTVEQFTFQADNAIGTLSNPQIIHTAGLLLREVPFRYGWNWLSFNLAFPDNSLNAALASLNHPDNDLMKGQTSFAQYSGGWFGTLTSLNNTSMFIYRADVDDTLRMQGTLIDPAITPIPVVAGWNWIGYIPNYSLPINMALSSLPAQPGDVIKSQHAFSEYLDAANGWVGNLKYLSPPNGYQIRLAQPGALIYPPRTSPLLDMPTDDRSGPSLPALWSVNPTQYEYTSTLIGMVSADGLNITSSDMELGAFAGQEVRGAAEAIYIQPLDAYLFFLTMYANTSGEVLRFKLHDALSGEVYDLNETLYFSPNQHQGSIEAPVPFEWQSTGTSALSGGISAFDIQPNPFSSETQLRFTMDKAEELTLTIHDAQGREVVRRPLSAQAGLNTIQWNGRSDSGSWLSSGVYMARLITDNGSATKKVVLRRLP